MKAVKIIVGFCIPLLTISCDKSLEVSNPFANSPEYALRDLSGFESVLSSAYVRLLRQQSYGSFGMWQPEVMADNMNIYNPSPANYYLDLNFQRGNWNRWDSYILINECNIIIAKIDGLSDVRPNEEAHRNQIKGEAFFLRALSYQDMARIYGYEPGREVDGFNLCVPLKRLPTETISEGLETLPRATNVEVYTQMEADLKAAIELLPAHNAQEPYRVGQAAAHALLARVYLYWGKWAEAAAAAEAAMATTGAILVTGKGAYFDAWSAIPHPESIFEADMPGHVGFTYMINRFSNNNHPESTLQFTSTPELIAALDSEPDDFRDTVWTYVGGFLPGSKMCQKWQGEKGNFRENISVIRYSEMMLTAAEGYARSGDEPLAREVLNAFRVARGLPATDLNGEALTALILKERRVEFALEGQRWFDLKRLGMAIPHSDDTGVPDWEYSDYRLLAPLPADQLRLNTKLVQNPGY